MKFHRIEPFPQETFYVLAEEHENVNCVANNPVCFSPINYGIEEVEAGDIPVHAKVVVIDPMTGRIRRVNLETAVKMSTGEELSGVNDVAAAVETLRAAFQRNGLNSPVSIQLEDSDQAVKLALLFGNRLTDSALSRLIRSITTGRDGFLIDGIRFTWPAPSWSRPAGGFQRLRQLFGAGGDLGSPSDNQAP
jgi:hypothetical protein